MAGKIIVNPERCKGCGLCVTVCPKKGITISKISNKNGYFPAEPAPSAVEGADNTNCTGCCFCAIICPDAAIEVLCDENITAVKSNSSWRSAKPKPGKKRKPNLISASATGYCRRRKEKA